MATKRDFLRQGITDTLPLFIPAIPFALVLGVTFMHSGSLPFIGWSSSFIMYGGASQLTLLSLLADGTAAVAAISAALIVNARHLMYSAAMVPAFQRQPAWFRWLGPYFLIDQVFALTVVRSQLEPDDFRTYYLAVGITFWLLWLTATAAAMAIGPVVPVEWRLGFAVPVMFTALVVMSVDRWPKLLAAVIAAATAWLAAGLPHHSGLLLGALAGVLGGMLLEKWRS
jgi:predicted branched-subunit amino acid permease